LCADSADGVLHCNVADCKQGNAAPLEQPLACMACNL